MNPVIKLLCLGIASRIFYIIGQKSLPKIDKDRPNTAALGLAISGAGLTGCLYYFFTILGSIIDSMNKI